MGPPSLASYSDQSRRCIPNSGLRSCSFAVYRTLTWRSTVGNPTPSPTAQRALTVRLLVTVSVTVTGSPAGCRRGPGSLTASVRAWVSGRAMAFPQVRSESGQTRNLNLTFRTCDAPGTRDWPLAGPIQELAPDP